MSTPTIVPGCGPTPNTVMLVGDAPTREDAERGQPFVGKSGAAQAEYLARHNVNVTTFYRTNVMKEYQEGNPDPTPEQIDAWAPVLEQEVRDVAPAVIIAVGRFAMRWFLGADAELEMCHGLPHYGGAFDAALAHRANGAIVIPTYHPALGFYDGDARAVIAWDYEQAARVVRAVRCGNPVEPVADAHPDPQYVDVTGAELGAFLAFDVPPAIGFDTEGIPGAPWSLQVSTAPGTGYVLRCSQPDFAQGVAAIQHYVDVARGRVVLHNGMYDIGMAREMGLNLSRADVWDTMYAAYLLRLEPQGLKPLAWRWAGMRMRSYNETVGDAGRDKQLEYLSWVIAFDWPKPEPRLEIGNDGVAKIKKPTPIARRALKILNDACADVSTDIERRWQDVDRPQREMVEREFGPMPIGTLDDIPIPDAVAYSARDADASLRVYHAILPTMKRLDVVRTMADCMEVLPVFEEMQSTGMFASRRKFEVLTEEVNNKMMSLQYQLSNGYFQGRPFNPMSSDQVATLMRRRVLTGEKTTSSGKVSTGKKSIEHLRHTDPAIALVMDWRECAKVRDAFCLPILERIPPDVDVYPVTCKIKTTRVATRRLAAADPNLLQIPARHELGKRVRDCYVAPPGQLYGAWDLSQIEMRYMAHESQDPFLCALFRENRDVHAETAAAVFRLPLDQVDKMKHRYPAKRAGFGILYGISGAGLYDQLRMMGGDDWSPTKCDALIEGWLDTFSGVREYIRQSGVDAARTGIVRDHWGMIRHIPGAWSRDPKTAAEAARISVSHKIQGGAQGMIQRSIAWLKREIWALQDAGLNVRWCLQIHDEIVLRFDAELWELMDELVLRALTQHAGIVLRVPVEAEGHAAESWGGLK